LGSTQPLDVVIVGRAEVSHSHGQHSSVYGSQGRGLLRGIVISHNTLYRNIEGGVGLTPETGARDLTRLDVELAGNADCTWALCVANPELLDFGPVERSLLPAPGSVRGAIQARTGAIELGPRP
jgi:hypothetical protein